MGFGKMDCLKEMGVLDGQTEIFMWVFGVKILMSKMGLIIHLGLRQGIWIGIPRRCFWI
jgi:hypothetical protein